MNPLIRYSFFVALAALMTATGCASGRNCAGIPSCLEISPPDIHLTGEKTVIERQMVGEYRELEDDAWVIASVKTGVGDAKGVPPVIGGDDVLFRAMKIREFNANKIRRYKDEGAVGEAANGLAAYITHRDYERDAEAKKILMRVLNDENAARGAIFRRSLEKAGKEKPDEARIGLFGARFAEEQRALARKNDWVQEKSGQWVKKK
ncbi:MAG TPA: DUF1318 domain-containing protein [Spirochaetes bacterium]|nr:DUF1318 domain-containing protein [Spirochaetota bacterium]